MAVKAPTPVPESKLSASLHKDVWIGQSSPLQDGWGLDMRTGRIPGCQLTGVSHIREDLRPSGRYEPLNGANDPNRMSPDSLKVVRAVVKEVTRGLVGMIPCGQMRDNIWNPQTFLDFTRTFLALKYFPPTIIPSTLYILQSRVTVFLLPYRSLSSTALVFCITTTPVAVHLPGGPAIFTSFGLGELNFFPVGIVFELAALLGSRPCGVWLRGRPLGWGLPYRLGDCFGRCIVQVLLDPPLQNVMTRGCCFYQRGWECLCIPYGVAIRLMDDDPVSTEKKLFNATVFSKEQFNMSGKAISSLSTHIPSIQLVTGLPNSTKGATKGHIVVSGPWAGSYEHPVLGFEPHRSLGILGKRMRGWLVEWVEKTSFDGLNKLFVISTSERNHETLLTY
ncbi:hypothetical protein CK203_064929 [Vitis vinifera]|uniref:Uncharacterized protein n=1 Tax=Vitis vinifera TaxID=29760 RepID=A0A438FQ14_VITVI|nr:hypothetical protein CK203_064929 [Vitis vinifera]